MKTAGNTVLVTDPLATSEAIRKVSAGIDRCNFHVIATGRSPVCST